MCLTGLCHYTICESTEEIKVLMREDKKMTALGKGVKITLKLAKLRSQ